MWPVKAGWLMAAVTDISTNNHRVFFSPVVSCSLSVRMSALLFVYRSIHLCQAISVSLCELLSSCLASSEDSLHSNLFYRPWLWKVLHGALLRRRGIVRSLRALVSHVSKLSPSTRDLFKITFGSNVIVWPINFLCQYFSSSFSSDIQISRARLTVGMLFVPIISCIVYELVSVSFVKLHLSQKRELWFCCSFSSWWF